MGINDSWLAYCLDDCCYLLEMAAFDEENYSYDWDLIDFKDKQKTNPNQKLIDFISK